VFAELEITARRRTVITRLLKRLQVTGLNQLQSMRNIPQCSVQLTSVAISRRTNHL